MNNIALDNLVEWIFMNKEIFNSSQYLEIMNLAQKLVVDADAAENNNYQILLHLNNYRLPESDSASEAEEEEEDKEEELEATNDLNMLRTSDAESSDDEEDFATYTGRYINSY